MPGVDPKHIAVIEAILSAIPPDTSVVHAMLACEDAYVALGFGHALGLDLPTTVTLSKQVTNEACRGES